MKTVEDAVVQENGVWREHGYNAMAWVLGLIDYCSLVNGKLSLNPVDMEFYGVSNEWQIVCTRKQFEEKAEELGYSEKLDDVEPQSWVLWEGEKLWYVGNDSNGNPVVTDNQHFYTARRRDLKPCNTEGIGKRYLENNNLPVTEDTVRLLAYLVDENKLAL